MAEHRKAPYAPQDVQEVAQLVRSLEANTKKNKTKSSFSCKKNTFVIPGTKGLEVDSWRFQEWDYKRRDLPTYARGLFTCRNKNGGSEIVTRGYDKFFNIDETNMTRWDNIETKTRGPYELSVKENGCIIFISGLPDDSLLVCSKHSTGARQDADLSHAVAGERWIDRQLEAVGQSRASLARQLRQMNATAVAELCDDSFEEHILAYEERKAGLYLHGINLNLPDFATYPCQAVDHFADAWGFKKTEFLVMDDIVSVRKFLEGVAETGSWHDRDVEGFVIRSQIREAGSGPYQDWFFKYKFEEPYLMFRQWREVTKSVIAGKVPRYKKHREITEEYLRYARRQLVGNPKLGKDFNQNHGIIAMRDGFLKEKGLRGSDVIRQEMAQGQDQLANVTNNVVLVPVATIGCGKTTVAVALNKLFGWGHIQNDNIEGRKNRPARFASEICSALIASNVAIADRNNHQKRERRQILDDIRRAVPEAQFVALHYVHEKEGVPTGIYRQKIRDAMWDRVFSRGDNHQTIRAGSKDQKEILGIMEGFLNRFEPVDPDTEPDFGFDMIIDLDPTLTSRENLETVISQLHTQLPGIFEDMPSADDLDEAIEAALQGYRPDVHHDLSFSKSKNQKFPSNQSQELQRKKQKPPKPEFFCVRVTAQEVLHNLHEAFTKQPATIARFYRQLQQTRRVQQAFHVTLVHRASSGSFPDIWQRLVTQYDEAVESQRAQNPNSVLQPDPILGSCRVQLERVVWDDRVMCIVARLLDAQTSGFDTTNEIAHITVGTARDDIKPKESNNLLSAWLKKGSGQETGIEELQFEKTVILEGTVKTVLSK
ncbi:MAG: hypothetical protein M4579_000311 [Chaenotheca gracillima]|nr:MAG: hypothetical protein M4579_000311 [Chaenotheca gracillima]